MNATRFWKTAIVLSLCVLTWACGELVENPNNPVSMQADSLLSLDTNEPTFDKRENTHPLAAWDPSGWQLAIVLEAKHALSTRNDGKSSQIGNIWGGSYYVGDYDYVGSDPQARSTMCAHYGWNWGLIGNPGAWPDKTLTNNWRPVGHGGMCKFFADLVQWRATGGRKGFLPLNSSASGSISNVQPGDIIQSPGHTAIVIEILARDSAGRVTAVDVIDSNFIGGDGKFVIARHPISGAALQQYKTYH